MSLEIAQKGDTVEAAARGVPLVVSFRLPPAELGVGEEIETRIGFSPNRTDQAIEKATRLSRKEVEGNELEC